MDHNSNLTLIPLLRTPPSNQNTLQLFPLGKKSIQRVILGSQDGTVQCFAIKRGMLHHEFKVQFKKPVTSIQTHKDRAFIATSNGVIRGLTKKGKEFYRMESTMTEQTQHMNVRVPKLWLAGEYLCTEYNESEQTGHYMSRERINCITTQQVMKTGQYDAVLGCQDRVIRVIQGNSGVVADAVVEGAVTSLIPYDHSKTHHDLLYATENGTLGVLKFRPSPQQPSFGWKISNEKSYVTALDTHDFTKDGVDDILVGRDNGSVQMYSFDTSEEPTKVFDRNLNESITAIHSGHITSTSTQDIIVSTYSGKVLSFAAEEVDPMSGSVPGSAGTPAGMTKSSSNKKFNIKDSVKKRFGKASEGPAGGKIVGVTKEKRIDSLQKDIEKLEEKLGTIKNRYSKLSEEMIAVHCKYSMKSKFILDSTMASYRLTIELDIPIDMVALSCDIPVDILEAETPGVVISTHSEDRPKDGACVKSTFRCTQDSNRVEIMLRTVEGQFGKLEAYVVPRLTPKTCQVVSFPVKPLSLHERVHHLDMSKGAMNVLTVEGQFSLEELHGWIGLCLEGLPDRVVDDEVEYFFKSTFQQTVLSLKLKRGEAIFTSNNVTTISILDEMITKQATDRKTRVQTSFKVNDASYAEVLSLLFPKLEYQLQLSQKVKLIDCLKEIQMQENDTSFLIDEYKEILENDKRLRSELKTQTQRLDFLFNIITRLFTDKYKYKRQNVSKFMPQLQTLLDSRNFTLEQLLSLFRS